MKPRSTHSAVLLTLASVAMLFTMLCSPMTADAATTYNFTPLGLLTGGNESIAYGVNIHGQVVGAAKDSRGWTLPFYWDETGGIVQLSSQSGKARSINSVGQIAGSLHASVEAATRWSPAHVATTLSTVEGEALSINESGQAVGLRYPAAALWNADNSYITLTSSGNVLNEANSINDAGTVVGYNWNAIQGPGGEWRETYTAFKWSAASGYTVLANNAIAYDINNLNQIVGSGALLWNGGGSPISMGSLGVGYNCAAAINDSGLAVGYSQALAGAYHAFVWSTTDGMLDLNNLLATSAPGWTLKYAYDISNSGHIVGYGTNALGQNEAFLLTPVPEPSSLLALAGGLLALGGMIRRRK